jgi:hypothetical protein
LRAAAAFTAVFAMGHGFGATHPRTDGAAGAVAAAMKSVTMDVFGSERTYWDFYEGYGYLLIVTAVFLVALLFLLSLRPMEQVRQIAWATAAAQALIALFSFRYFFWAPGAFNAAAAALTAAAAARR